MADVRTKEIRSKSLAVGTEGQTAAKSKATSQQQANKYLNFLFYNHGYL